MCLFALRVGGGVYTSFSLLRPFSRTHKERSERGGSLLPLLLSLLVLLSYNVKTFESEALPSPLRL